MQEAGNVKKTDRSMTSGFTLQEMDRRHEWADDDEKKETIRSSIKMKRPDPVTR